MKRHPAYLALSALDIARFFLASWLAAGAASAAGAVLAVGASPFPGTAAAGAAAALRALGSPGLVSSFMLFLLWFDEPRNAALRSAAIAGKALAFLPLALALPSLAAWARFGPAARRLALGLALVACYDLGSLAALLLRSSRRPPDADRAAASASAPGGPGTALPEEVPAAADPAAEA